MSKGDSHAKKEAYFVKLEQLLEEYPSIFIVGVDNVGSNQMHQIRISLRGTAVILMGKNTMVRRVLRNKLEEHPEYEKLLAQMKGNVGFVFTKGDLKTVRDKLLDNRVKAPAKAGALANVDVFVPATNTGMEPGKTSFFQALGIPTKIARGTIEIVNEVHLVKSGTRVGPSEATLLNMLNISPFTYGMIIRNVYDRGTIFSPSVLDVDEETLLGNLVKGISTIACISLALGYPTVAAVPHILVNGYKNLLAIALSSEYSFEAADKLKEILSDPAKMAALAAASAPAASSASAPAAAAAAPVKEEPEEDEDEDMGFDLFG